MKRNTKTEGEERKVRKKRYVNITEELTDDLWKRFCPPPFLQYPPPPPEKNVLPPRPQ